MCFRALSAFYRGAPAEFANIFDLAFCRYVLNRQSRLRFTTVARLPSALHLNQPAPTAEATDEQKPSVFQDWVQKQEN